MAQEQEESDSFHNEGFSTERLIEEVRIQSAIWDFNSSEYSSRMEKLKAWETICVNLIPNFENLVSKEKNKKVLQLQKRWKGLRSCFNREKNRKKEKIQRSGSSITNRKEYQYFAQLSFLALSSDIRPEPNPIENIPTKPPTFYNTNSPETEKPENDSLKYISNSQQKQEKQQIVNDPDLNFLYSMLPHFKKVSDEYKLDLQSEMLDTLKKYVNFSRSNNLNQQPQYAYLSNSPSTSTIGRNTAVSPENSLCSEDYDVKENIMFIDE